MQIRRGGCRYEMSLPANRSSSLTTTTSSTGSSTGFDMRTSHKKAPASPDRWGTKRSRKASPSSKKAEKLHEQINAELYMGKKPNRKKLERLFKEVEKFQKKEQRHRETEAKQELLKRLPTLKFLRNVIETATFNKLMKDILALLD